MCASFQNDIKHLMSQNNTYQHLIYQQSGVSLFECLLVIVLTCYGLTLTLPIARQTFATVATPIEQHQLIYFLNQAHKMALLQHRKVIIQPLKLSHDWSNIGCYMDHHCIHTWRHHLPMSLHWWGHFQHRNRLTFLPNGQLDGQQGHFYFDQSPNNRFVIVNQSGYAHAP